MKRGDQLIYSGRWSWQRLRSLSLNSETAPAQLKVGKVKYIFKKEPHAHQETCPSCLWGIVASRRSMILRLRGVYIPVRQIFAVYTSVIKTQISQLVLFSISHCEAVTHNYYTSCSGIGELQTARGYKSVTESTYCSVYANCIHFISIHISVHGYVN